jgi:hypothetical protein
MQEHNKGIKDIEEAMEHLSAEIQGGAFQPILPFGSVTAPRVTLAETDPDVQAAKAAENTDATAPGSSWPAALATALGHLLPAAAEPTPAGEAASPAKSEQQRKPRSDKGKARGPRKVEDVIKSIHPTGTVTGQSLLEPDAREPGFEFTAAAEEAPELPEEPKSEPSPAKALAPTAGELLLTLPIMDPAFSRVLVIATDAELEAVANSEKARRIPPLAIAVKRELRRRANAEAAAPEPEEAPELPEEGEDAKACESCGHSERVHGSTGMRGCMVGECGCRKLRLPLADPDPLGLDDYPERQTSEVSDASA